MGFSLELFFINLRSHLRAVKDGSSSIEQVIEQVDDEIQYAIECAEVSPEAMYDR